MSLVQVRQSRFHVMMAKLPLPPADSSHRFSGAPQHEPEEYRAATRAHHDTNLRLQIAAQASRQDVGYGILQTEGFAIGRPPLYRMIASDQQRMTQYL